MPAGKLLVIAPLAALKMLGRDLAADNLDDVILIPYPREYLPTAVPHRSCTTHHIPPRLLPSICRDSSLLCSAKSGQPIILD
jgi:hypothetical protein